MRNSALLVLVLLFVPSLSCRRPPVAPAPQARLEVFVHWEAEGVPDRRLEIVELGLSKLTDAAGIAVFTLPPGRYTLRADVNSGGPPLPRQIPVTVRLGSTERVEVSDCLPCM
jgi:hypothetical protein